MKIDRFLKPLKKSINMKSKKIFKIILVVVFIPFVSCSRVFDSQDRVIGQGPLVKEERLLTTFSKVYSQIGADINIIESNDYSIEISIQENLLPYLSTRVVSNELVISFNNVSVQTSETITIDVYVPMVSRFSLSGAGNINSNLPIGEVYLSGSGNVKCAGETQSLDASITGAGNFDFFDMIVNDATVRISGSGNVKVFVNNNLNVTISGMGTIYYKGHPTISQTISGLGSIVNSN